MTFLSYKVVRGTCLRFPEQLQVVVAGDVLQQRLPARPVALTVLLCTPGAKNKDSQNTTRTHALSLTCPTRSPPPLTMYFSFCSLLRPEFLFLLSSVTFSL